MWYRLRAREKETNPSKTLHTIVCTSWKSAGPCGESQTVGTLCTDMGALCSAPKSFLCNPGRLPSLETIREDPYGLLPQACQYYADSDTNIVGLLAKINLHCAFLILRTKMGHLEWTGCRIRFPAVPTCTSPWQVSFPIFFSAW